MTKKQPPSHVIARMTRDEVWCACGGWSFKATDANEYAGGALADHLIDVFSVHASSMRERGL